MDALDNAIRIAKENLRSCYAEQGILAGHHHFDDYWARDSLFASSGCNAIKDYDIVRKNLELFLRNMRKDGMVPLRIGKSSVQIVLNYAGFKIKHRAPVYHVDKSSNPSVDQNSLFIIALYEYSNAAKDKNLFLANQNSIQKIVDWNFQCDTDHDLLMEEAGFCNWEDSVDKRGKVLYTNVCHCHAIKCYAELLEMAGKKKDSEKYVEIHNKIKTKINELFWSGEHYIDWIDNGKTYNYFSTDGNILAIIWDIADKTKARHIEECTDIFKINDVPSSCCHPFYPAGIIAPEIRLIGLGDYHTGLSWIWLGAINAIAKNKLGMKKEAVSLLDKMASMISSNEGVFEVYENTGKPVKRLLYKSEFPLSWNAGMFLYAVYSVLKRTD